MRSRDTDRPYPTFVYLEDKQTLSGCFLDSINFGVFLLVIVINVTSIHTGITKFN